MASLIPGGLWQEKAPPETPFPYQTFIILGQPFDGWTSNSVRRKAAFEIHTYYKTVAGADPEEAMDALVDATEEAFEDGTLTVSNRGTMVVRQNDRRSFEEDAQVYRGLNEFDLILVKSR